MKYIIRFSILFILIRLNQICPEWIKFSDGTIIEHQIFNFIYCLIRFNQICPKWIKMDQTWSKCIIWFSNLFIFWSKWIRFLQNGSNLIKLNFWWNNHWNIWSDFLLYLFFDQVESDLSKIVNLINIIKCAIFINFISLIFFNQLYI